MQDDKHVVTAVTGTNLPEWATRQQTAGTAPEATAPSGPVNVAVQPLGAPLAPSQFRSEQAGESQLPATSSAKDVYANSKHGQTNKEQWGG